MSGSLFVKGLDLALQSFHVHRQQYHSGAFVGNNVLKSLLVSKQCKNIVLKVFHNFCIAFKCR